MASRSKRMLLLLAGTILVVALVAGGVWLYLIWTLPRLPPAAQVQTIIVKYFTPGKLPSQPFGDFALPLGTEFTVPAEHVPLVLEAFEPADWDRYPSKWIVIGNLEITRRDGLKQSVDIYWTGTDVGAFAVDRNYFRGGSDRRIVEAIREAHDTHQANREEKNGEPE